MPIQIYDTRKTRITKLAVPKSISKFYSVYSLLVTVENDTDIVDITGQFEVTNDIHKIRTDKTKIVAMVGQYIIRTQVGASETQNGKLITPRYGMNVTPDMHHMGLGFSGRDWAITPGQYYYNFCLYSASTAARSGDYLDVHSNYGFMNALVHRQ